MTQPVTWPEGARCAIMMTFDLDGVSSWSRGRFRDCDNDHLVEFKGSPGPGNAGGGERGAELMTRALLPANLSYL